MNDQAKINWLAQYYKDNKLPLNDINLIGIRNPISAEKDVINDYVGYFTKTSITICPGTTEPSVYWTKSAEKNVSGTFHLKEGFHEKIWCVGTHKGYEALVNDYRYCKPTKGWRDANYNFTQDSKDVEVCDYFGINFHRMHPLSIVDRIGKYSAGCQVFQNAKDFNAMMTFIKSSQMYLGTSEKTVFNYMLFAMGSLPKDFLV
jgi:hypothetical protein